MFNPVSSYRIQFNKSFTLHDLEKYVDYLSNLGVGSIYASPVFKAVPGSNHGYDVTGAGTVNPEIGSVDKLRQISSLLKEKGMGWIQDIVPNHMAYHPENEWIWDLLEKGPHSEYSSAFDLESSVVEGTERLMLPFLGSEPGICLKNFELQLQFHKGSLAIKYSNNLYPASFESFRSFLMPYAGTAPECFRLIWNRFGLAGRVPGKDFLNNEWEEVKREIEGFCKSEPAMNAWTGKILDDANADPLVLQRFIDKQHYEPCHWKETSGRINYRRFFTVNGLICMRMEDKKVMSLHHRLLIELIDQGVIDGLRVDHVDGLRYPAEYLQNLRTMAGEESYIIVEKILEHNEEIPGNWPVAGTTGYDFLAMLNNLMVNKNSYSKLQRFCRRFTGETLSPQEIIYNNKKLILNSHMRGELDNLFSHFEKVLKMAVRKGYTDYSYTKVATEKEIKGAIGELMLACPVYRFYPETYPPDGLVKEHIKDIFVNAAKSNPAYKTALGVISDLLLKAGKNDTEYTGILGKFFSRMMQLTGPLMAKGVEDTSMYQYSCFIAGNEVGDRLDSRGMSKPGFHEAIAARSFRNQLTMNCTSTHDTKRGEDVRARLNAIADLSGEWTTLVRKWERMNRGLKCEITRSRVPAPSPGEEYFIYQTIAGTFPFDEKTGGDYISRIKEYLVKALREAKQNSNWEEPDENYEQAVCDFAESILKDEAGFKSSFIPFHRKLAWRGITNSLSQLAIKCCTPGTPDIYRGTELWDLNLVDPDNRRMVNFSDLQSSLGKITGSWKQDPVATLKDLYSKAPDGRIKLLITSLLLNFRRSDPGLFQFGEYFAVESGGRSGENIFAFARKHKGKWLLCVVPLWCGGLSSGSGGDYFSKIKWKDTHISLPDGSPYRWKDIMTQRYFEAEENIQVKELFRDLPVAVLEAQSGQSDRNAGILLHISSLNGDYGIGDFGEEAYRFADLLAQGNQTYWQTLPLSPVTGSDSWSPYSSPSAFACNTLFISPFHLWKEGLLNASDIENLRYRTGSRVNYKKALKSREVLLDKAFRKLNSDKKNILYGLFEKFCLSESGWLDDYAVFMACRKKFRGKEWARWPSELKKRDPKALKTIGYELADDIGQEKFNQFIACRQWAKLKGYANNKGISIFGDIPFYVSYDSADVWANKDLFSLRPGGKMDAVAGVPPDYFDSNGQLWNMPVYNWEKMKESGYDWWVKRLEKNLDYFDLLRLDHFRAFSEFWEVPAGRKTAINGKWVRGPGADFLMVTGGRFPSMPFVAEDLGDIDQAVYELKDQFGLPGMQVLQFSFGPDMATSLHTPHNHKANSLVYTGTHDNNTIRGWYGSLDRTGRTRLNDYTRKKNRVSDIHHEMIRMAYASVAKTAIIPMQDLMGLGSEARMNTPSTSRGNWLWKLRSGTGDLNLVNMIRKLTVMYNRV